LLRLSSSQSDPLRTSITSKDIEITRIKRLARDQRNVACQHTGKKVLSLWGRKSNPFIELLVGLVVWSVAGLFLVAVIAALVAKP
jgi:hypothetical protein